MGTVSAESRSSSEDRLSDSLKQALTASIWVGALVTVGGVLLALYTINAQREKSSKPANTRSVQELLDACFDKLSSIEGTLQQAEEKES